MFQATKRELGELYTFFRLLADGQVYAGNAKGEKREMPAMLSHSYNERNTTEPEDISLMEKTSR